MTNYMMMRFCEKAILLSRLLVESLLMSIYTETKLFLSCDVLSDGYVSES